MATASRELNALQRAITDVARSTPDKLFAEEGPALFLPCTRRPSLSRERIAWRTTGSNVNLDVELVNEEHEPTEPTVLVIEAAALGAFVPGWVVAKVPVGAIAPKGRLRVARAIPQTALPRFDQARIAMDGGFGPGVPPPDVELVSTLEWAGNLNVWFDSAPDQAVEVHRALDLRVKAGRRAAVGVFAPARGSDFHAELECMGAGWTAELLQRRPGVTLVVVETPVPGRRAVVNLLVTRRSDQRQVLVEFVFRSVDGPGESLACVRV